MKLDARALARVETALGHEFADRELLRQALTHPSAAADKEPHYERLEFLGDRVLGLVVARLLYDAHGAENEGDLAKRHVALVRGETLAEVAATLELEALVQTQPMEQPAKAAIAADALEALIGALYLDGGLTAAEAFIRARWSGLLAALAGPPRDAKTALQEWAQARGFALPRYRELGRVGPDHAPRFTIEVSVSGHAPAVASDTAKRMAEQAAAALLLARIASHHE